MSRRVNLCSSVKSFERRSQSESESEQGAAPIRRGRLHGLDPKPGELTMARVKVA
jgi:hypothetical protein